jgi:hypothetical protein
MKSAHSIYSGMILIEIKEGRLFLVEVARALAVTLQYDRISDE